jgi:hypothetical protein
MTGDLTERIEAIHAEAMADLRSKLVDVTDHDLELLLERDKSPLPLMRTVAEQILAERKAQEQSK